MKKIILVAIIATAFAACNSESKDPAEKKEASSTEAAAPATGQDGELTKWLSGRMLVSTAKDPATDMWNKLKLNADGTCTDKDNAAAKWSVKDGQFIFESVMNIKKKIEKKAGDTLVLKSDVGMDETYVLQPIN